MKIVFMGTPDLAAEVLDTMMRNGCEVSLAVTQPDRPKGRGRGVIKTPVHECADKWGIPVFSPVRVKRPEAVARLREEAPDLIVVAAFGQILSKEILELPRFGCVNVHASLLPKYRGAAPIQWAVINGEEKSGVTIMQMDEGLDTGDMLHTLKTPIAADETADSLHDRLSQIAAETMRETLTLLSQGMLKPVKQDDALACTAEKITKDMSRLDFTRSAQEVDRTIRAVTGFAMMKGRRIKLHASVLTKQQAHIPAGTVIGSDDIIGIVCGDGMIVQPTVMQAEGAKAMPTADFLRGFPLKTGDRFTAAE